MPDAARRQAKLRRLLERLQAGQHVQNRDLQTWLTARAWAEYEDEQRTQQELRSDVQNKPDSVREYERRVAEAHFAHSRAEGYSAGGRHDLAKKFYDKTDTLCERAMEYLQEIIQGDGGLRIWFDRDTSWTADSEAGADIELLPRVVTSRSLNNRGGGILGQLRSKRDVKIWAVEQALAELAEDAKDAKYKEEERRRTSERLQRFLALRDDE